MDIFLLKTILSFSRKHNSKGEQRFLDDFLEPLIREMGYSIYEDAIGNWWVEVETPANAPFLFVSHIDTCHTVEDETIHFKQEGDILSLAEKSKHTGCLGADDGVGIYANLMLMEKGVGGTYLFTRGEEKGLIGAEFIAKHMSHRLTDFTMCIEVDRAGYSEVITEQASGKCASDAFAQALADCIDMGLSPSTKGVYTDNSAFNTYIPECVNLAAGYLRQHTQAEQVDLVFVENLVDRLCKIDYYSLPIERETSDIGMSTPWWDSYEDQDIIGFNDPQKAELSEFEELLSVCTMDPEAVATFLYSIGADSIEIYTAYENYKEKIA